MLKELRWRNKAEGALRRFHRHRGIYHPMWWFLKPGRVTASLNPRQSTTRDPVRGQDHPSPFTPSHRARPSYAGVSRGARPTHRLDEFRTGYSSIGMLASRARLRFTGRDQHKAIARSDGSIYHRIVTSVLTGCLSPRGHFKLCSHVIVTSFSADTTSY
jgi:hypothetical protein